MIPTLISKTEKVRKVFVVSSGRTGTTFLTEVFSQCKDTISRHEARPRMTGSYLTDSIARPLEISFDKRLIKPFSICLDILCSRKARTYVETNHMFIKSFWDVAMSCFKDAIVIILRRPLSDSLRSFFELGYFSDSNPWWPFWMHFPSTEFCAVKAIGTFDELDQIDRIIAYLIDIEARSQNFVKKFKRSQLIETTLNRIITDDGISEVLQAVNVDSSNEKFNRLLSKKSNDGSALKALQKKSISTFECGKRIDKYLTRAGVLGVEFPQNLVI